jgi:hypothetical protein
VVSITNNRSACNQSSIVRLGIYAHAIGDEQAALSENDLLEKESPKTTSATEGRQKRRESKRTPGAQISMGSWRQE